MPDRIKVLSNDLGAPTPLLGVHHWRPIVRLVRAGRITARVLRAAWSSWAASAHSRAGASARVPRRSWFTANHRVPWGGESSRRRNTVIRGCLPTMRGQAFITWTCHPSRSRPALSLTAGAAGRHPRTKTGTNTISPDRCPAGQARFRHDGDVPSERLQVYAVPQRLLIHPLSGARAFGGALAL